MSLSLYQQSVPVLQRALRNLRGVLVKADAHCQARKIDPVVLTAARLYPDMFALSRQAQIACDMAKGCVARLSGTSPERRDDGGRDLVELQARIDQTLELLQSVPTEQIDGKEELPVTVKTPFGEIHFTGEVYVQTFVLPNVYFHCATAYNILRHNGVDLGKRDFLGDA